MSDYATIEAAPSAHPSSFAEKAAAALQALPGRIKLRHLVVAGCAFVATVPVLMLGAWVEQAALEKHVATAREKHLMLARNMAQTLERYAADIDAVFTLAVSAAGGTGAAAPLGHAFKPLHIKHVCVFDADGRLRRSVGANACSVTAALPREMLVGLAALPTLDGGSTAFTPAMVDHDGAPTLYAVRALGGGGFALAAVGTSYLVELQQSVAFGERGHAAIVDRNGRVLAHPNATWRAEMKDLSRLYPVREMMAGRDGTTTFYSPSMQAEMLAAYAAVPKAGWGVMVPQPMSELAARAGGARWAAMAAMAFGVLLAAVVGRWLAGLLLRPIEAVARAAARLAAGDLDARVGALPRLAPRELKALGQSFDDMAAAVGRHTASLSEAAFRADLANRAKSEFLASMSHELRTPLNSVLGFAEIMKNRVHGPVANEKYQAYVADIHASAHHLLTMVNEILDLAKAESGRLDVQLGPVDLAEVIDQAVRMVRPRTETKEIAIVVEMPRRLIVESDELKLRQALINLLSNAVKFTADGGTVRVQAGADEAGVWLRIRDNGIGIAEPDLARIFEPFFQVDRAFDQRHEGTGLGLVLAKKFVEHLGGALALDSALGRGTTVEIRLPRAVAAALPFRTAA